MRYILILAVLMACSGKSERDGATEDERAFTCGLADRMGAYKATYETEAGDCVQRAGQLIQIYVTGDLPAECTATQEHWSEDGCRFDQDRTCATDAGWVQTTATTVQLDDAGDVIAGTVTFGVLDASGALVCSGSYDVTFTREAECIPVGNSCLSNTPCCPGARCDGSGPGATCVAE